MTFNPTFEMYALAQKISDGDPIAIRDLWVLIFKTPLDETRPLDDIMADISDKFVEYAEAKKAEEEKKAEAKAAATAAKAERSTPLVQLLEQAIAIGEAMEEIRMARAKRK